MSARTGASLLHGLGIPWLAARGVNEYGDLAIALARSSRGRSGVRDLLLAARRGSRVFDVDRWVASFEASLRAIWELHEAGLSAMHTKVT